MDSFEINKIVGAVLFGLLIVIGIGNLQDIVIHKKPLDKNVYIVEGVETASSDSDATKAPVKEGPSFDELLATASISHGEKVFKKCATCHDVEKDGRNKVGPELYGIVGRKVGTKEGFSYSDPVANHGGSWTFDDLDHWLKKPQQYIPGTKMSFAGLSKVKDRADVIAFLNSKSDSPLPIPTPAKAEPEKAASTGDTAAPEGTSEGTPEGTPEEAPAETAPAK